MNFRTLFSAFALLLAALFLPAAVFGQQGQAPTVKSIEVQYAGATTIAKERILANMQTRVGRPYDEKTVEDDIRHLYATGNITNVRIFGEPQPDGVKVIVVVQAKAQITEVILNGVTSVKPSRLRKEITSKVGETLNEATVEADRQKILDFYSGKNFTEIDVRSAVDINEKLGTARVTFNVTEGDKISIHSINVAGNVALKTREIKKVIKTKPKSLISFLTKTGRLNTEALEQDVAAIRELYQSRGYVDVEVAPPTIVRKDGKADVTFNVREGIQYHVGTLTISGAQVFSVDELTKNLKTKAGAIYSPQAVRADIRTIQDLYGARGYIDFQAGADTTPAGPGVVNVSVRVEEGVQSYVEHINIVGNTRTKDKVIRREVAVAPGDLFNTVRVDATKARLMNLNYFGKVDTFPADTLVPGRKDLNITLEEKRTGSLNFGAGFSSIDSLLGFAEITQSNFDITNLHGFTGGGQRFRARAQYGTRRKDFVLSLTEPYFLDYKVQVGGEIFYRDASFVSSVYDERRYGFDLNASKPLNDFTRVRLGYRLEDIDIHDVAPDASSIIQAAKGQTLESRISSGITYDTRDNVFLTRKGEKIDLGVYVAGGPLGGDVDIYGFDLEATKYISLPGNTILTLNGEIANVATWNGGSNVPIFDRLYLGGANNLRGFKFRDVGPKDEDGEPIGGSALIRATVEYTFPIVEKVRGAVFYDVGGVGAKSYKFGGINSDFGVGLRLDLPIGPIRIDYGIPITSDRFNDSSGKFNFNIGYQF
ncbi:MAG: bamA [Chthoniobacteraceae bacterium]|nr:bamA [Chthoniobacteraceae bacterium]